MMRKLVCGCFVVALLLPIVAGSAFAQTTGTISAVTVYQGQALVTRDVRFEAVQGPQEFTVRELPEMIVPDSLYATGNDNLTIRAVRYRASAVAEDVRPEVKAIDDQIKAKEGELRKVESQIAVLETRSGFLDNLERFAAEKVTTELDKGTLNPAALTETAQFIFQQRDEIATKTLELADSRETITEEIEVLQRQRAELAGTGNSTVREAALFVDAAQAGPATLKLSYLVAGVGWAPAYSARLNDKHDIVSLQYHALVTQMSGENWPQVNLTLSTSNPDMRAAAPILSPLQIALVTGGEEGAQREDAQTYAETKQRLQQQMRAPRGGPKGDPGPGMGPGMGMPGGPATPPATQGGADDDLLGLNYLAAQLQNTELTAPDEVIKTARILGGGRTEGMSVDYPIPGAISIESRRDQQMFHIATVDLKPQLIYTAVPLLTDYVYRSVECTNASEYPFLPGPYSAYLAGAFAGRGQLPLVAQGQGVTMGFGTETRLRASRELEEKTTTVRGGNKVLTYTYRLRLSNFMDAPAKVQLWERIPKAPSNQVTVTLVAPNPALSEDPLYLAQHRPRGLLRWDVEVPAKASGANAFSLTYQLQIELDKNYDIGELPDTAAESMRKDLEVMRSINEAASAAME